MSCQTVNLSHWRSTVENTVCASVLAGVCAVLWWTYQRSKIAHSSAVIERRGGLSPPAGAQSAPLRRMIAGSHERSSHRGLFVINTGRAAEFKNNSVLPHCGLRVSRRGDALRVWDYTNRWVLVREHLPDAGPGPVSDSAEETLKRGKEHGGTSA